MRRNLQRLMVVMAAMMICLGASAIDKVVKKVTLTGEVTSVADLQAAEKFLLQDAGTELMLVALDGVGNYWDFNVATPATMIGNDGKHAGYFKLDKLSDQDHFRIEMYNINGSRRGYWGGDAYVNAQPGGNVIFGLDGQGPKYGQDGQDLALWDIEFDAEKGFAFKCVGRAIYIGSDGAENARPSDAPVYWKAYTGYESGFVAADIEAAAKSVESALKTSDAKAAFADAKTAYEADKDVDAYAAAINAAIDVINMCEQVNKAYANYKLSTLGTAAVKAVVDKYNAGEYKDVAALGAAYVEAVKAQNCDGADMTGAIINPSFELGTIEGWTSENCGNVANNFNFGGRTGDKFCERWQGSGGLSNGKFYQALTGLPNGTYKVTADLQNREQGNGDAAGTGFFVFANDDRTEGLDANNGKTIEVTTEVADGNLTLGVQLDGCSGNWICFDNFTLTLVKAANAVVPEKDAWYTGADFFRFRADKNAAADSPYAAYKDKVEPVWGAAPLEESNGCIVCKVPANVNPQSQIWIRGTEAGKTIANGSGDGFRVTFRVKADGEYTLESQAHNNWGYKIGGNPFGPLNVTTEWQTVSFVCTGEKAKNDFTDLCFNLSGDAERTFYFDDVQIVRGDKGVTGSESVVKTYNNVWSNGSAINDLIKSDDKGNYIEVVSPAKAEQDWDSQIFISIPKEFVGKQVTLSMDVKASAAVSADAQLHKSNDGNGYTSAPAGDAVPFTDTWTTVTRVLDTSAREVPTWWGGKDNVPATNTYVLNLTKAEEVTYGFKNITFVDAAEPWTESMAYRVKVTPFTDNGDGTWTKGADTNEAPEYDFGTGGEEGGYFKVTAAGKQEQTYETQFFFQIADAAPTKALKKNETVNLKFKIKALATETLEAGKEIQAGGGFHNSYDGAGWLGGAPAAKFTVGEWTPVELKLEISAYDKGLPTCYSIDLSQDAAPITYLIDEVEATWAEAPVFDWVDLIPLQDFEAGYTGADDEPIYFLSKENVIAEGDTHRSRIVEGAGKDSKKGIEFRTQGGSANWDSQFEIRFPYQLPNGTKYRLEFDYMCDATGNFGTQSWDGGVGSYATGGTAAMQIKDDEVGTWKHYSEEYTVNYTRKDGDVVTSEGLRWDVFDLAQSGQPKAILFIDNISVKVPAGTLPIKDAEGNEVAPDYLSATEYPIYEYIDPTTLDWSNNILKNGDLSGDDMSEFVLKNNDYEDPETLPVEKTAFGDAFEIDVETAARPTNEDGSVGGNDHDAQFFVRLPYVLPKGKKFNLEFDLYAEEINTLAIQAHAEPGQWKANLSSVKTDPAVDAVHYQEYLTAPDDIRTIAINLAVATDATYAFSNFSVQVVKDDMAEIEAATTAADAASLWNETLALNEACYAGRVVDTEGCTEESVKALTDAVAAGKAELKNEAPTAESLAAATKAITDAIAGLEKAGVIEDCDLTADMFFTWDAVDATASKTGQPGCAYDINKSTGMPYGDGTVNEYNYADLSAYDHLAITATEGEPRLLFNRAAQDDHQGPLSVELPRDYSQNKYEAVVDNGDGSKTYVINLKEIVAKDGYAHLHAIKGANWANTTVTEMKLFVGASQYTDVLTNIFEVADDAAVKDGKYFIDGQIVIVKDGVKYNAAGVAIE